MSRTIVLAFLLLVLIISSQFEWKEQLVSNIEARPIISQKQEQISEREEAVKEKIILIQEKDIQRLKELVRNLREQLLQCHNNNKTMDSTPSEKLIELKRPLFVKD